MFKAVIIAVLIVILLSLTKGLHFLMKDDDQSKRMVKSLTIRVVLSIFLFLLILFGYWMGWIAPNQL